MGLVLLVFSLILAIALESTIVGFPFRLLGIFHPSSWMVGVSLLLLLGWCFGE